VRNNLHATPASSLQVTARTAFPALAPKAAPLGSISNGPPGNSRRQRQIGARAINRRFRSLTAGRHFSAQWNESAAIVLTKAVDRRQRIRQDGTNTGWRPRHCLYEWQRKHLLVPSG